MNELIKRSEDWLDYHKGVPWETDAMKLIAELVKRVKELEQQLTSTHRDATEEVAKAHKRGWEQAKRECENIAENIPSCADDCGGSGVIYDAIAAMEYKEKVND